MRDKDKLHDELTDAFINYQYRLENPMPAPSESFEMRLARFRSDPVFNTKVRSMVGGVMQIVGKYLGE